MKAFLLRHKYVLGVFVLLLAYVFVTSSLVVVAGLYFTGECGYKPLTLGDFIAGLRFVVLYLFLARMFIPISAFVLRLGICVYVQLPVMIIVPLVVGIVAWIRTKRKISTLLWCFVAYVFAAVVTNDSPLFVKLFTGIFNIIFFNG